MRFETRSFLVLVLALVVGLSMINFLSVAYVRTILEDSLEKDIDRIYRLYVMSPNTSLPDHIRIGRKPTPPEGFRVVRYTGKHFIFLKEDYLQERLKNFSVFLLMWEALLVMALVLIFHRVVVRYLRREQEAKDMMSILLLALTHRLGNFLSVQKVNLELIERSTASDRLKESVRRLERHYRRTLEVLEDLREGHGTDPVRVNLTSVIDKVVKSIPVPEGVTLKIRTSPAQVRVNPVYVEVLITSLVENAFRYARSKVYIKLCRGKKGPVFVVRNDIKAHSGGSGMGLQIVKFITKKIGAEVRFRIKDHFTAVVVF